MLDANMVGCIIRDNPPEVRNRLLAVQMDNMRLSTLTQGEMLYALAKEGSPEQLAKLVQQFLQRIQVMPWDEEAAAAYGELRASCEEHGVTLGTMEMMLAAHAIATTSILVTHNKAYSHVPGGKLLVQDWVQLPESLAR